MDDRLSRVRTLDAWIYEPTDEDKVCKNRFHEIVEQIYSGSWIYEPNFNLDDVRAKVAQLMKAQLILLGGDVIYVRENNRLHTLGDSIDLLSYYMHADSKEARKAIDILETNFQGYFPVVDHLVARDVMELEYPSGMKVKINLKTLKRMENTYGNGFYPEFGSHKVNLESGNIEALRQFFSILNQAVGEPYFFEKTLLYHFNQPYREKSHVLVGGGGNGKSMFMGLVQRFFGDFAYTDSPQPNFSGHDKAVIAYNFIGKRVVTFNDVGDPSEKFLEWLKRMITGNLEVKTPSGAWLSVPCSTNFLMETNHTPQVLGLEAHRRRFVIREFSPNFRLKAYLDDATLDKLGDKGDITAGDIAHYLGTVRDQVQDWATFTEPTLKEDDSEDMSDMPA